LWAYGRRSRALERRLYKDFEPEIPSIRSGYEVLSGYMNKSVTEPEIEDMLQKTFRVKILRESDAYMSLRMSGKNINRYFQFEGIEHLRSARKENRPIIILTGHIGSFFNPSIAFSYLDFEVYPIARSVSNSPATPLITRLYLALNYRLIERGYPWKFIMTDFSGKIDRTVVSVSRRNGIFWVAVDFPWRLYQLKHLPVKLFGQPATLPSGIIQWGIRKNALFLTGWNSVEEDSKGFYRLLSIDSPIEQGTDAQAILQVYADRLSDYVIRKPWQWMALPVIQCFGEGCSGSSEHDAPASGPRSSVEHLNESMSQVII
jgi:lauroyl/myristoyl acyltransferase